MIKIIESKKVDEDFDYYASELKKLLPLDEYEVKMKFTSTKGSTKTLDMNSKSMKALNEFFRNNKPKKEEKDDKKNNGK